MRTGARRLPVRPLRAKARRALWPVALLLAVAAAPAALAQEITGADYEEPTERYPHGALGDPVEHGALVVSLADGRRHRVRLDGTLVFEDTAPRLVDLDGDGAPEILTVESHRDKGARLAVWGLEDGSFTRLAATPFIGTRFRWLAPVGVADLDGDGRVEIAYVETPHLGKTLRIVRLEQGRLVPVAAEEGLTNHHFGAAAIEGGIATCAGRPTILTADAGWSRIIASTMKDGRLTRRDLGPYTGPDSFARIPGCH
ncbi:MAG: VCBS repeat-containing protein [Rhodobacteraceae bacterium]|nr:VCBS repeat-containing protein [Paracoccaceae bacterium]